MIKLFTVLFCVSLANAANISVRSTDVPANPQATTTATVPLNAKADTIFNEKLVEGVVLKQPNVEMKKSSSSRQSRQRVTSMRDALQCGLDFRCFLDVVEVVMNERKQLILGKLKNKTLNYIIIIIKINKNISLFDYLLNSCNVFLAVGCS